MPVAFIGGAGSAITFLSLFVGVIIVSFYLFFYAAHCFLIVVEQTAVGNDEVAWSSEMLFDRVRLGLPLAWLVLVWLAPLGMVLHLTDFAGDSTALALLPAGVLWLTFPIGVLSGLTGESRWNFFRPSVLARLLSFAGPTLTFYAATAGVVAVGLGAWVVVPSVSAALVPVAALISAAAVLLYARLLGRLAWIAFGETGRRKPRVRTDRTPDDGTLPPPPKPRRAKAAKSRRASEEVYGFTTEEVEPPPEPAEEETSARKTGYELADPDTQDEPAPGAMRPADDLFGPTRRRLERSQERLIRTRPPRSFLGGVWSFPWYQSNLQTWLTLAALAMLDGMLLVAMLGSGL